MYAEQPDGDSAFAEIEYKLYVIAGPSGDCFTAYYIVVSHNLTERRWCKLT